MNIPLTDLKAQYRQIKDEVDMALAATLESGQFILGPEVTAFEKEIAAYVGTGYGIGVASGTDALHLAMLALGIGAGDEVITTPFTFIATVDMMMHCGARPVFVDIDPATLNMDTAKLEAAVTSRTKAILPVHLYGLPCDMTAVMDVADRYGLKVIEDVAQALGSEFCGKKLGSIGHAGCLSFFPSKSLGAYGDGGLVVTNDAAVAERVDMLRRHGAKVTYYYEMLGYNSRLDALQAAVLRVKLRHLDEWTLRRRDHAARYADALRHVKQVRLLAEPEGYRSCYNYFTIYLEDDIDREALRAFLKEQGIATAVYYPLSLHLQKACQSLDYSPGDFPHSERAQGRVLSLPMYPELDARQIDDITGIIGQFIRGS